MGEKPPGLRCQQIKLWAPRRQVGAVKQGTGVTLPCGRGVQTHTCIFGGDKEIFCYLAPHLPAYSSVNLWMFSNTRTSKLIFNM